MPEPEPPMTASVSPSSTQKLTLCTASWEANVFVTSSSLIISSPPAAEVKETPIQYSKNERNTFKKKMQTIAATTLRVVARPTPSAPSGA